jgi:hypothetical protein
MLLKKLWTLGKTKKITYAICSGHDCHWAAVTAIGPKKMRKTKNVTYAIWSGRGCHRMKKKGKKFHAHHLVYAIWSGHGCHQAKKKEK